MPEQEIEEIEDSNTRMDNFFKQFDYVTDFSDHHYAKASQQHVGSHSQASKAAKRIMQEWKMLQNGLPETIFVRVYEERYDLLRACIIGAQGTPYHDGLFFFDFEFPSDYPAQPPKAYYHSHGLQINPNLYANGKVCLSLLNTWSGRTDEKWNAKGSTILQVLVSLQALVLNDNPYYNEPMTGVISGLKYFEKKSLAYNEDVFVLNCVTMVYVLRKPPMHFKEFVFRHFREQGLVILVACKAYMDGKVNIGGMIDVGSSSLLKKIVASKKFKDLMEDLCPKLVAIFASNGSPVGDIIEQLNAEKEKALDKPPEVVKTKDNGFVKRVMNKIKKMLRLKKIKSTTT